jgi:diguanylate cyclase (GGDEF)-like protein/PAS domain S-box-containing protein
MPRKKNSTPKAEPTETTLYQQQQQLAALLTHIPAYAFFKDTSGVYITASKMFCDALTCSQADIEGKTDYDLVPKALADKYRADDLQVITTGEPLYIGEENMLKSGKMVTVVTRKVPLKDPTGKVIGLVGTGFEVTELKQAQITLQKSEQRYRLLFENSPVSLWKEDFSAVKHELNTLAKLGITDFRTYFNSHPEEVMKCAALIKIIEVNKATLELYHAANQEELRQGLSRVFGEESYPIFIEELVAIAEGKTSFEQEAINLTLTGEKKHVIIRWSIIPAIEETLSTTIVSIFDITDRKHAEEALQNSEQEYRATIDAMGDAIHVVDPELKIILLNQAFKNWLNILKLELNPVGKTIFEVFPFLPKKIEAEYRTVFETKQILITQETSIVDNQEIVTETRKIPILEKGTVHYIVTVVRDITEQKRAEIVLQKSEETYRSLVENINDVIFTLDTQGKITYISPPIERIAGYNATDILGKPFTQLVHPDDLLVILGSLEQSFAGQPIPTEFRLIDRTAMIHFMRGSSRQLIKNNQVSGLIGIMSDITDRKQMEEQLRSLSLIDELTGLYNRRGFLALAEQQIKIAHRLEKRMLLLFADIDNMKWINDTFGHQQGDQALMEITTVFKETFRESDIIARIGGDEFVILAIEIDASSAEILSQRLQENLDTHNTQATRNYRLAVSTGIARYVPESPRPLNELLEQADKLMYEQKRKKQNLQKKSLDTPDKTNQY